MVLVRATTALYCRHDSIADSWDTGPNFHQKTRGLNRSSNTAGVHWWGQPKTTTLCYSKWILYDARGQREIVEQSLCYIPKPSFIYHKTYLLTKISDYFGKLLLKYNKRGWKSQDLLWPDDEVSHRSMLDDRRVGDRHTWSVNLSSFLFLRASFQHEMSCASPQFAIQTIDFTMTCNACVFPNALYLKTLACNSAIFKVNYANMEYY